VGLVNANDLATVHYAIKFEGYPQLQQQMPTILKGKGTSTFEKKKKEIS